jgi:hypothetical protein
LIDDLWANALQSGLPIVTRGDSHRRSCG